MSKHLPMARDASIPFNQCQFKLFNVDSNSLFCRDLLVEINHKLIESTIAYFLGLDITKVEEMAVTKIDLNYAYARNCMFGLTLDQVQHLFATTDNPVANKYRPILSELIFTQVLPLFNQQPKHDDFKKEIDIMNNLSTAISTMSSVEIAELTGKRHDHVMRDISNMITQLEKAKNDSPNLGSRPKGVGSNLSWHCESSTYTNKQNKSQPCYLLDYNTTVNLLTGYDAAKRMMVIQRWQQLENKSAPAIPQTYSAALLEAAKLAEQTEKLQLELKSKEEQIEHDKNFTKLGKMMTMADTTIKVGDYAIMLQNEHGIKIGQNRLFEWFREHGYLCKEEKQKNRPTQKSMELGLFNWTERIITTNHGEEIISFTPRLTGKAQVYFIDKLIKDFSPTAA